VPAAQHVTFSLSVKGHVPKHAVSLVANSWGRYFWL